MSVVVRMEMPENCGKCPFAWYCGAGPCFCTATLERNDAVDDGMMWKEADPNKKPQWCPIICQLPEGHGRLVDADANFIGVIHLGEGGFANYTTTIAKRLGEEDMRVVKTIVPAEAERSET